MGAPSSEAIRFEIRRTLQATPERAWPIVSDTDTFNQSAGFGPWAFSETPDALGGSVRTGSFRAFGMEIVWREHPFDWVVDRGFRVLREYQTGPFTSILTRLELERDGAKTNLSYEIVAQPRGALWRLIARAEMKRTQARCEAAFDNVARYLEGATATPYPLPAPALERTATPVLANLTSALEARGVDANLGRQLVETLRVQPDAAVARMSPYELANVWGAPGDRVLWMFLEASRIGALDPTWDLICPLCRGAKHRVSARGKLPASAFCPSCNARYEVELDETVELSFRPSSEIRVIRESTHCVGGPGNTRHILVQQGLAAGAEAEAVAELGPGLYRLRSARSSESALVRIEDLGAGSNLRSDLRVEVDVGAMSASAERLAAGRIALQLCNRGEVGQLLRLERLEQPTVHVPGPDVHRLRGWDDVLAAELDCVSFGSMVEIAAVGALPEAAQEALERHIERCTPCTERLAENGEALARVALAVDPHSPSRSFESVLSEIDR